MSAEQAKHTEQAEGTAQPKRTFPSKRRRFIATGGAVAVLAAGGLYVSASALVPLPVPEFTAAVGATESFPADDAGVRAAVDAESLPTAVGWLDGDEVWANDDDPHPLASITKLVTALVGQEAAPLAPGEEGPLYTWTDEDTAFQEALAEVDGIAYPVEAGTEVSQRQLLTLALVPSANDFATAYARSIFGDTASFVAAASDWADRHELASLRVTEPSGIDDGNVASAADVVQLARLTLSDPALAEIVALERATLPWGIGEVENTNPLLAETPDSVGVKTGHTELAGYSLAAAARGTAAIDAAAIDAAAPGLAASDGAATDSADTTAERELTRIAVVLGRDSVEARTEDAERLLGVLAQQPQTIIASTAGEPVGSFTSVDGQVVEVTAAESYAELLVPGEELTRSLDGVAVADSITVAGHRGTHPVPVRLEGHFTDPTLWWRLTHPHLLFSP
ncbi:D-alanyl-D-alanine carboxypeptidase family protein [Leucobacter sp. BZR 635]